MLPTPAGSFRLFQVFGINVYLHWSWLLVAVIEFQTRMGKYESPIWNVIEYLSLFVIVLLHEFGHALACRSVGGIANQIVLWPLGGVAYVRPPRRPGALLWSIAAGPLVNVLLVPVTWLLLIACPQKVLADGEWLVPDITNFCQTVFWINIALLIFNVLPIYPLDGGQILQSLLWFVTGQGTSIVIASVIGMIGGIALGVAAWVLLGSVWMLIISLFIVLQAWSGLQLGLRLQRQGE
jgi:Zn-dependent protease